ncbi:MAG TPA: DMT family transporter [Longimicrobiales bacterium]|nr:DMT family transporter [Longimicrobiales bacterium]
MVPWTRRIRSPEAGLVLTALIWAINFSVAKAALSIVPPLAFNALRYPLAGLAAAVALRWLDDGTRPLRSDLGAIVALGLLGNVAYQLLFIEGLDRTLASNSAILMATAPVWTAALAVPLAREQVGGAAWLGILLTVAGVTLVVLGGASASIGEATLAGDLLTLGAAFAWGLYTVLSIPFVRRYGPLPVTVWTMWVGAVVLPWLGIGQLREVGIGSLGWAAWAAVAYAGVLSITVAYVLWYRGVQALGGARTATYGNLVPVVAIGVAWAWLGERPAPLQLVGAALTVSGIAIARRRPRPPVAVLRP